MASIGDALSRAQRLAQPAATVCWMLLALLCVLWEWQLAPLRPGGSWLVLKAAPLLLPLRGIVRGDAYVMQWATLLVLAYFCEGVVRAFEPAPYSALAFIEIALAVAFFVAAIAYLRPLKRAARTRAAAGGGR